MLLLLCYYKGVSKCVLEEITKGEITKRVSICVLDEISKREIRFDWGTADSYWGTYPSKKGLATLLVFGYSPLTYEVLVSAHCAWLSPRQAGDLCHGQPFGEKTVLVFYKRV